MTDERDDRGRDGDAVPPGFAVLYPDEDWVATISHNFEFVAPARPGDWIECRGAVTRRTGSLVFVRGAMTVGETTVVTCSTILRRLSRDRR